MTFPNIKPGQYTIMFLDRFTGQIYDVDLKLYFSTPNNNSTVYVTFNSFSDAKEYADQKIKSVKKERVDFGYIIFDHQEKVKLDRDSGRD